MWPVLLDMTKEESMQSLRNLELEAYAHLVSALRAQGPLNPDKRKLLKDTGQALNIPQDRHKAEIRRAVNDEKLNTIAYHVTGLSETLEDWSQEGRRNVPLLPRLAPQTAYSAIADEAAETVNQNNKQLPPPACTERKRPPSQQVQIVIPENKGVPFRVPDTPKNEDSKKRKLLPESSSLAQHLLGPTKMSRAQQIYRQKTKNALIKEQAKLKQNKLPFNSPFNAHFQSNNGPKAIPPEETIEQIQNEINNFIPKSEPATSNENQAPRPKLLTPAMKPTNSLSFKQGPGANNDKTLKLCTPKKNFKPGSTLSQKLIVVSNAQSIQNNSILQKTLTFPLVKNISVKNFEKFKIVTTSSSQGISCTNNISSLKHKVVTVKANPTSKKVIPLSLLNSKGGIKVFPIGSKIVGKSATSTTSSPLYIVNTMGTKTVMTTHPVSTVSVDTNIEVLSSPGNGKSTVLENILKASGVTADDFDSQIEEFRIPNNHVVEPESEIEVQEQVEEEETTTGLNNEKESFVFLHENEEDVGQSAEETMEHMQIEDETAPPPRTIENPTTESVVLHVQNNDSVSGN